MSKLFWLWAAFICITQTEAQEKPVPIIQKNKFADSIQLSDAGELVLQELPVLFVGDQEKSVQPVNFIPSLLKSNRDVLSGMAAFHFNVVRFRLRGYDARYSETSLNGISMNFLPDAYTQWNIWSGLNDVTANNMGRQGLGDNENGFGSLGTATNIDMRASRQRPETRISYAFSNRNIAHRWMYTTGRETNQQGWAWRVSVSKRLATNGYYPGSFYNGISVYLGVDKKLAKGGTISLMAFEAFTASGRQNAVLEESVELAGSSFYNAGWGFQNGRKRNANQSFSGMPVAIASYEHPVNNHTNLRVSLGLVLGEKSNTALDWLTATDPRPDYYRYLPSFQKDAELQTMQASFMKANDASLQVNWDRLYDANQRNHEVLHDVEGIEGNHFFALRSHYIVAEKVTATTHVAFNGQINQIISPAHSLAAGISISFNKSRFFKRVNDLLGGDYFVDRNQFASRDFPGNEAVIQNDLNKPNRPLFTGDVYGYDYAVLNQQMKAWVQLGGNRNKWDYFLGISFMYQFYLRDGNMRNGLFSENSYGRSEPNEFNSYAVKTGLTYKLSGKKYIFLQAAYLTMPPLFDDVYISPRTRDTRQNNINNEKILSLESGYVFNSPSLRYKLGAYYTAFRNKMNVISFYHDGYGSLVNYALTGVHKLHMGLELGVESKISQHFTLTLGAAIGRYYDDSRQSVTVTSDNDAYVLERGIIYSQNYRVGGTPQEAYGLGLRYQSSSSFFLELSANYFAQHWLDYNPMKRTNSAIENVLPESEQWKQILAQPKLPDQYTIDLSSGIFVQSRLLGSKEKKTFAFFLSVNNLLNNKNILSGGYEQMRFDIKELNPLKFPPKYYHAMGLNFSANISIRFL